MKSIRRKSAILLIGLCLLAGCGAKSTETLANGGSITLTIAGQTAPTTVTYNGNGRDPSILAEVNPAGNATTVTLCSGVLSNGACSTVLKLKIYGTTPQVYSLGSATAAASINYQHASEGYQATGGSVSVTALGDVGAPVAGTIDATLDCVYGCTGSINMTGSFTVLRSK